ncbi:hypothetical protein [Allohahella sp. A8]
MKLASDAGSGAEPEIFSDPAGNGLTIFNDKNAGYSISGVRFD